MGSRPEAGSLRIILERTGAALSTHAVIARTVLSRMVGLLRHDRLEPGEGLVLTACRSIHTIGMRFPIDAVFTDRHWRVVALRARLEPGRMTSIVWRASQVVELPAGTAQNAGLRVGDQLRIEPMDAARNRGLKPLNHA